MDLIDAQVDLALRITQKVADGLIARPVCQIESVFCAHPDYLKQHSPYSILVNSFNMNVLHIIANINSGHFLIMNNNLRTIL